MKGISEDKALKHYGVLGMRWGIRKNSSGTSRKEAKTLAKMVVDSSGKNVSRYDEGLRKKLSSAIEVNKEFQAYRKDAASKWSKYLKESDAADGLYDKTVNKIHRDPKFKEDLKKIEADLIKIEPKGTRGYEKAMDYSRDALEAEHPLMKDYTTKSAVAKQSQKVAYDSCEKLTQNILKHYGNKKVLNAQAMDVKVKDIVANVISNKMMSDYYMSDAYKP